MYSVIDIGSNTIRLTVYQVREDEIDPIFHEKTTAGLVGYLDEEGFLSQAGIQRASTALNRFRQMLEHLNISNISVFATAALRNIGNTRQAVSSIEQATGFQVQVLSGEQEALLDYVGATHFMPNPSGLLVDIGGGSTELVRFTEGQVECAASMPIGSLNLYNKYVSHLLPGKEEREQISRRVKKELDKLQLPKWKCDTLCGVGGTVRAVRKLINGQNRLPQDQRAISMRTVCGLLNEFQDERKQTLLPILKAAPDRIHTLVPGMIVLCEIAGRFGCETVIVSDYGVREGYLLSEVLQVERRNHIWQKK